MALACEGPIRVSALGVWVQGGLMHLGSTCPPARPSQSPPSQLRQASLAGRGAVTSGGAAGPRGPASTHLGTDCSELPLPLLGLLSHLEGRGGDLCPVK